MKKVSFLFICLAVVCSINSNAQNARSAATESAVYAYAKGSDSYLLFSDTYKADKKYVVFKFWQEGQPLTAQEKTDLEMLQKQLAKKGMEVKVVQWKTRSDLESLLNTYNVKIVSKDDNHLNIKGDNFSLNTTSGKATLVLEEGRPLSLCSGTNCEDRLKTFFKIKAVI